MIQKQKAKSKTGAGNRFVLRLRFICERLGGGCKFGFQVNYGLRKDRRFWHLRRRKAEKKANNNNNSDTRALADTRPDRTDDCLESNDCPHEATVEGTSTTRKHPVGEGMGSVAKKPRLEVHSETANANKGETKQSSL